MKHITRNKKQSGASNDICYMIDESGFTLIEVLIYSAVLAIFMGAAFVLVSSILGSADAFLEKNELLANQEFVERKLIWALAGASGVLSPPPNSSSTGLTITGSSTLIYPAVFSLDNNQLTLSVAEGAPELIANNRVRVNEFKIEHFSSNQYDSAIKISLVLQSVVFSYLQSSSTLFHVVVP
ncbi:MAG: type II secretion system protein [Patescibacteria group bacterium]